MERTHAFASKQLIIVTLCESTIFTFPVSAIYNSMIPLAGSKIAYDQRHPPLGGTHCVMPKGRPMSIKKVCAQVAAVIAITAMFGFNVPAQASGLTWNWSWSDTAGGTDSGNGTLTTNAVSNGSYLITGMSGTWDGNSVSGLLAPGTCCATYTNDNLLYAASPQLGSLTGLAFSSGGNDIQLYTYTYMYYADLGSPSTLMVPGDFSATLTSVPEPGTLALLAAGLAALGFAVSRRKLRTDA